MPVNETEKMEKKLEVESKGESASVHHSEILKSADKIDLLKAEFLRKVDLFGALDPKILDKIALKCPDRILKKDEILFEEGQLEKKMYVILSGCILICKGIKARKRIAVLGVGEYFGEMSLIDAQPRSASAIVLSDALLMEIPEDLFRQHIVTNPEALLEMMKVSSLRIRHDLDMMSSDLQKISNFTHDMRNCLVPLGIAEILMTEVSNSLQGTKEYHKARKGWEKVKKSFDTMLSVRNNLVTMIDQSLACVKKAKTEYVRAEAEIVPLVKETVEELECHKFLRGKNIQIHVDGKPQKGIFNSLDIKRVLQNLIINAGYVTKKAGKIDINVKEINDTTLISVKDYGCGIPEELKSVLLNENFTSKPDGNGFGLMSCKEIIEDYHQGKIYFESEEGKGTEFHFTLGHAD